MFTPWRSGARSHGMIDMSAMLYSPQATHSLFCNCFSTTP